MADSSKIRKNVSNAFIQKYCLKCDAKFFKEGCPVPYPERPCKTSSVRRDVEMKETIANINQRNKEFYKQDLTPEPRNIIKSRLGEPPVRFEDEYMIDYNGRTRRMTENERQKKLTEILKEGFAIAEGNRKLFERGVFREIPIAPGTTLQPGEMVVIDENGYATGTIQKQSPTIKEEQKPEFPKKPLKRSIEF